MMRKNTDRSRKIEKSDEVMWKITKLSLCFIELQKLCSHKD